MVKHLKTQLHKSVKRFKYLVKPLILPDTCMHKNVPYFSQWESRELNGKILGKRISTDDDPNWQASGAQTKQEYHDWSWAGCGMACTKMIVAHQTGKAIPLVELGKKCAAYGGYTMPLAASAGLLYKPFVAFAKKELGLDAKVVTSVLLPELMHELSQGSYIIASVSNLIRDPASQPKTKGGHLVLLLGYDKPKQEFYFHNPSGTSAQTQEYATISFNDFKKFFSGRGIVVRGDL